MTKAELIEKMESIFSRVYSYKRSEYRNPAVPAERKKTRPLNSTLLTNIG